MTPASDISRRKFLASAAAAGGAAFLSSWAGPVIDRAYAQDPGGSGSLNDIEHFVYLMQENRSFDHYYGTLSGVRGFDDPSPAWQQYGWTPGAGPTPTGFLNPFRLDTTQGTHLDGECINDPTHSWGPQHDAWNGGAMDRWMPVHIAHEGPLNGPATMGYYTRADIPVHYDLADAFTICDHYFCSVLGPTDPNRLYWMTGTIDPDGLAGGPLVETPTVIPRFVYSWRTYPENLQEAGVSWKVYANKDLGPVSSVALDGMLGCFTQYSDPNSELARRGLDPTYPNDFRADVANGTLPAVSWIVPNIFTCEHPALPPAAGAVGIVEVLDILTSNPAIWEKTALIISYDENGGFFDHVTPPTPPPGTPGEYLTVPLNTVSESENNPGPIGLGFRVPSLIVSPYSRGGLVASDTFDHTSQLRLLEKRFGVPVPNLTDWRRGAVGDMTSAFDFSSAPNAGVPVMTDPGPRLQAAIAQCGPNVAAGTLNAGAPYPVPPNSMPVQEQSPLRRRPSGLIM
ncbi:phospholipase C [Rhodococcus opacus]|uniref:phospholipase C n=1 Tax=Rhodococcus opacus M213 TaxID=1129896 RepID=K8XV36_RHOOP|nr:alkaline phosphatase family protein [Rhodococcus opacus]ELB90246.1 phospholipase C [Rhodococcus wratislaviensis IFP 2016]EKT80965.1 phospholipase C [Rhodococcus opacus M213]MDX5967137.1 alkaline phosphatase family protein [Rhodococcus opacus]NKY70986.1 phospholipase C [Rhodococcus opacus]UZG54635.1 twin-arginine translocation signal domain-containing protein [Rhodococcus opacus]